MAMRRLPIVMAAVVKSEKVRSKLIFYCLTAIARAWSKDGRGLKNDIQINGTLRSTCRFAAQSTDTLLARRKSCKCAKRMVLKQKFEVECSMVDCKPKMSPTHNQ